MADFNWKPGVTDRKGGIGTPPNNVAPGKRMLSSQTPTIVAKGGKPVLVTGSPGSRTIINTVLCVVVNVVDFDMDVQAAVDAPRMHHAWFTDELKLARAGHVGAGFRHPRPVAEPLPERRHRAARLDPRLVLAIDGDFLDSL